MSFTISEEDKNLIKLSCEWLSSKKKEDKNCGEYLLEQILNKYMNELMKEYSCTSILTEVLDDRTCYDNSYKNLCHLDLIRKCKEIKELVNNEN